MILLTLGVLLWSAAHLFKRLAPETRARMGDRAKGQVALALLVSVIMMVQGYRMADGTVLWGRSPALTGLNNLLILVAFYLFAASGLQTRVARRYRHPQLTGFALWAVAHLLVNGDAPSLVLFGGLLVWALAEIALINRAAPAWTAPPAPANAARKEVIALIGGVVAFGAVALIHLWLGYDPFG